MDIWSKEEELIRKNKALDKGKLPDNTPDKHKRGPTRKSLPKVTPVTKKKIGPEFKDRIDLKFNDGSKDEKPKLTKVEKVKEIIEKLHEEEESNSNKVKQLLTKNDQHESFCKEIESLKKERNHILNKVQKLNDIEAKNASEINELKLKLAESTRHNTNLNRDIEELQRNNQKLEAQTKTYTVRIDRQEEAISKLKDEIKEHKEANKEIKGASARETEDLKKNLKSTERDFEMLFDAFAKQDELVDMLQKQKLHLEIAQVLEFSGDEFLENLDWNLPNMNKGSKATAE